MSTPIREYQRGEYVLSTDRARLDVGVIHHYLSTASYWARGRPYAVVARSIAASLCFGIYAPDGAQAGFARVITDYAAIAWLCDVFVLDAYRGQGLGKWLVETVVAYPELQDLKRILLATRDAEELYRQYGGFHVLAAPEKCMERSTLREIDSAE